MARAIMLSSVIMEMATNIRLAPSSSFASDRMALMVCMVIPLFLAGLAEVERLGHLELRQLGIGTERLHDGRRHDDQQLGLLLFNRLAAEQVAEDRNVAQNRYLLARRGETPVIQPRDGEALAVPQLLSLIH